MVTSVVCWQVIFAIRLDPNQAEGRVWSENKLFDTQIIFLKEFSWKFNFEKMQQTANIPENFQHAKS